MNLSLNVISHFLSAKVSKIKEGIRKKLEQKLNAESRGSRGFVEEGERLSNKIATVFGIELCVLCGFTHLLNSEVERNTLPSPSIVFKKSDGPSISLYQRFGNRALDFSQNYQYYPCDLNLRFRIFCNIKLKKIGCSNFITVARHIVSLP